MLKHYRYRTTRRSLLKHYPSRPNPLFKPLRWYVFLLTISIWFIFIYILYNKVSLAYARSWQACLYVCYIHNHSNDHWNIGHLFYFTKIKYVLHLIFRQIILSLRYLINSKYILILNYIYLSFNRKYWLN